MHAMVDSNLFAVYSGLLIATDDGLDSSLWVSYITHDSSKHFESIIILNHAYG